MSAQFREINATQTCCNIPFNWLRWGIPGNTSRKKPHYLSLILVLFLFFRLPSLYQYSNKRTHKYFFTWISFESLRIEWIVLFVSRRNDIYLFWLEIMNLMNSDTNEVKSVNWIQINKFNHTTKMWLKIKVDKSGEKFRKKPWSYFIGLINLMTGNFHVTSKTHQWNVQNWRKTCFSLAIDWMFRFM